MKLGDSNAEAHQRALSVLQSENLKLLNEINQLRSETGSADLMNYQQQIKTLKQRILEL